MAIVTLFISAALALLWFLETQAAPAFSPMLLTLAEAGSVIALYFLFVRVTTAGKTKTATEEKGKDNGDAILVAYASQTGVAEEIASRTVKALEQGGYETLLVEFSSLSVSMLEAAKTAFLIVSTTGEGDPPDGASRFASREMASPAPLAQLRYGVLALGDKSYRDFCAFGRHVDHWLKESGADALFERIDVDRGAEDAMAAWFENLEEFGASDETSTPHFENWRLEKRRLLNPGSDNPPVFHISLKPAPAAAAWRAGDIAVVAPRNGPNAVEDILRQMRLDGDASVVLHGENMKLKEALAKLALPDADEAAGLRSAKPQGFVDALRPLSPREYSLASLPADGAAELVVRQMRYPDGRFGACSGWLTEFSIAGTEIEMRIRSNASFHGPIDDRPMILMGAGSGIAGLRAHIKERIAAGRRRNWLVFGERSEETDFLFREDIESWRASGALTRLDLCFAENGKQMLVQDILHKNSRELCRWLKKGAAIYVTGSRAGVGAGVQSALEELCGRDDFLALTAQGRYKTDVY